MVQVASEYGCDSSVMIFQNKHRTEYAAGHTKPFWPQGCGWPAVPVKEVETGSQGC